MGTMARPLENGPRNMPLVAIVSRRALIGRGPLSFAHAGYRPWADPVM